VKLFSLVVVYQYFRGTVHPQFFGSKVKPQEQAEHFSLLILAYYPSFEKLKEGL
jgi:hypothetical protein